MAVVLLSFVDGFGGQVAQGGSDGSRRSTPAVKSDPTTKDGGPLTSSDGSTNWFLSCLVGKPIT